MSPATLIAALRAVPLDCTVTRNRQGNLAIFDVDGDYLGYIDTLTGELSWL